MIDPIILIKRTHKDFLKKIITVVACVLIGSIISNTVLTMVSDKLYEISLENTNQIELVTEPTAEMLAAQEKAGNRDHIIRMRLSKSKEEIDSDKKLHQWDVFFAGRLAIWNVYFQNMTWRGSSELMFYDTEYAHNQYIELSYKAGIPTGIIYLIFNLIAGILALRIFIQRKDAVGLLSLSAFIVFFIISMLDTGVLPFERGFIFLYYITLTPLLFRKDRNKTITKD